MTNKCAHGHNPGECHEVWRQDDNGNKFLISAKKTKADAEELTNLLTARGHKQMYWFERCKNSKE